MIEKQVKIFKDQSISLVYTNSTIHNQLNKNKKIFIRKKLPSGNVTSRILSNYTIGISTVILRKSFCKNQANEVSQRDKIYKRIPN